ncbi:hypothetical protein HXZ94_02825 [Empedobacter falsenii]|uniref:hypothetical protein n=1 Tax=Empedobacter falsenii TaxID=343874 RepID=UPI002576C522|nr:hypothetical protein [Empedobacter falsenii]MDM1297444.1 hypothetical protein [Empedobacter falsenii]MDM1317238.1 hypothetical protein [Empedobacter falsenii]
MKFFFLIIISIFSLFTKAQTKLDLAIKNLEENYAQEKVYILFNKEDYISGENIWFKAFVFDGYKKSNISTNLFVELYDKNKTLIDKKLLPIISGQSDGSFTLKDDLEENVYYIRAYTTYMTYFSEDFQYIKPLLIYNPNSKLKLVKNDNLKWNASVYPEGGTFIENQTTRFAVRLKSIGDLPEKWNGFVFEKNNPSIKIIKFNNLDENIAAFYLRAEPSKTYQLQVNDENGNQQIIDLPIANRKGLRLKITTLEEGIEYNLQSVGKALNNYRILANINNKIVYNEKIESNLNNKITLITIPDDYTNGIIQFTVFDNYERVVAKRLAFIYPPKNRLKRPMFTTTNNNDSRALNTITINPTKDTINYTTSLYENTSSVRDNFITSLYFTGDFKSKINHANQYLKNVKYSEAFDALLISEEWKRFDWNNIMNSFNPIKNYKKEKFLSYNGKIYVNHKPLINSIINLTFKTQEQKNYFFQFETNEKGEYKLDDFYFFDKVNVNAFANGNIKVTSNSLNSTLRFSPLKGNIPEHQYILTEKINQEKNNYQQLIIDNNSKSLKNTIELQEALVTSTIDKTKILDKQLSSTRFQMGVIKTYDFINDAHEAPYGYLNAFEWIKTKVSMVKFMKKTEPDGSIVFIPFLRNAEARFYLDEMPVTYNMIFDFNMDNIAMVKLLRNGSTLNAIAFYTKKINSEPIKDNTTESTLTIKGYDKSENFMTADSYEKLYRNIKNDVREDLYWNPNLISEPNKETIIEYYNNDKPKDYQLTIIGFDEKGNPVYYEGKIN